MIRSRWIYTFLLYCYLPWVVLRLRWRARYQRGYGANLPERFGYYRQTAQAPLIWIHAVSVGETRAAEPLLREFRKRYPDHHILLTHMTPTGRATARALFGNGVTSCYLPYDFPGAVKRFLNHFRPAMGILIETEIWPNLVNACCARAVPLYLVNARLSERSFMRYRRFAPFVSTSLQAFTAIAAQSGEDAERLTRLGARNVQVMGNLKFDIEPSSDLLARGKIWRAAWGQKAGRKRSIFLLASTREGEEVRLLDAFQKADISDVLLVIVPRHPQRFAQVAALLARAGIRYQRRSSEMPPAADVGAILGDSMGEMSAYYFAADLAFVGGSLLPYGGQNLIEACAVGCPVVVGPHVYNFSESTRLAVAAGAALQLENAQQIVDTARALLTDSTRLKTMAQAGRNFVHHHEGAARRAAELIAR